MSRKKGLSREELQIHHILSPSSQGTQSTGVTPGQTETITIAPDPPQAPVALSDECMERFAKVMSKQMARTVGEVFEKYNGYDDDEDSDDYSDSEYMGTDRATEYGDDAIDINNNVPKTDVSKSLSLYGIGVNANAGAGTSKDVDLISHPVVEPDNTLPPAKSSRSPTNWYPLKGVLAWATANVDGLKDGSSIEMSDKDRKDIIAEFSPNPQWDHLFTAVSPPVGMTKAMDHPDSKKFDYMFNRLAAEEDFQRSHEDISCGLRLLCEVMSDMSLKNGGPKPGMERNRTLLGRLFQILASATSFGLRGRRELGRKFIPYENATALFATQPSHYSFFGGTSIDSAVTEAVAVAKVNKDLIYVPKKRPFRFRSTHPGGKSFYNKNKDSKPYKNQKSGKFQSGRGGRGRGGNRRKKNRGNPKPTTQE